MAGDLPEARTLRKQFVDQSVMGAATFGHRTGRFGSRGRSRFLGGRVDGLLEAAPMLDDALLHGGGQVLPEVESVGDLHGLRRGGPGGFCIGAGPVPADHRWC